ncbi:MAG: hypothetical protein H6759_04460 [Candidatus Nomurabacteria bacterium]|nr:MAG: hypothetical protein H6759_04460 [Candidatus Nomurabacteria bacterium]
MSRVLAKCDIQTPIDKPSTLFGFTCITKDIPEDKQFLVRFYAGDEQYAVVTNYPKRGEPTNECQFARGLIVQDIRVNGASLEHRIIDIAQKRQQRRMIVERILRLSPPFANGLSSWLRYPPLPSV